MEQRNLVKQVKAALAEVDRTTIRGAACKNGNVLFCPKHHFWSWIMYIYAKWPHMSSLFEKFHPQPKLWGKLLQFSVFD